ncbi:TadE/TadG family type IV pilus assembly protein [Vibrio breoganii]|uniref:TadE/TadG family type IV pilus assembly protein n=1 Tax=Vibrio breoganii TaxID=553239 RepID=UPI00030F7543|nr:TadE/TadG family type IV pilus assembly protein [Vibrio breoganii]
MMNKQRGVVSIEFGLGAFALFLTLFAVFEMGRFGYSVNMTDTTLSESTRKVRIYEGQKLETAYADRLQDIFESDDSFWNQVGLVSVDSFNFDIEPYASLTDVANGTISEGCERCPIVVYQLSYDYSPVVFEHLLPSAVITRRILTIQEHEGWEDDEA